MYSKPIMWSENCDDIIKFQEKLPINFKLRQFPVITGPETD